jgi:hypothetical protein
VVGGDAQRVAALPSAAFLVVAIAVAVVAANMVRLRLPEAWPLAISALIALPFIPGRTPDAFLLLQGPISRSRTTTRAAITCDLLGLYRPRVAGLLFDQQSYSLTPGERREITLPPPSGARAWVVDIHSGPGFRPFEREPGNTDVRLLAAWFEIP